MKIKTLFIALWILILIFLSLKTSPEPVLTAFSNSLVYDLFKPFPAGNSILFATTIGFFVSTFFYLLVVWYPQKIRRKIIKNNFREVYKAFKSDTIYILINACNNSGGGFNSFLLDKLADQNEFRKYFNEKVTEDQTRWDAVFNGLDTPLLQMLSVELEILLNEVSYVLNNVYISDKNVFLFFKRLSQSVYKIKNSKVDYDDIKNITSFLWQIFAGYSLVEGYREEEIINLMIDKI